MNQLLSLFADILSYSSNKLFDLVGLRMLNILRQLDNWRDQLSLDETQDKDKKIDYEASGQADDSPPKPEHFFLNKRHYSVMKYFLSVGGIHNQEYQHIVFIDRPRLVCFPLRVFNMKVLSKKSVFLCRLRAISWMRVVMLIVLGVRNQLARRGPIEGHLLNLIYKLYILWIQIYIG